MKLDKISLLRGEQQRFIPQKIFYPIIYFSKYKICSGENSIYSNFSRKKKVGKNTGHREFLLKQNNEIRELSHKGMSLDQLSSSFCLSYDSIKKIVYNTKK